jgi:OmpA-OmpF porin, OOP family
MRGCVALPIVAMLLYPLVGTAQDLSDADLLKLFQAQRDAYQAAQAGNTGLTRGLTLVTADDVTVATEAPTTEAAIASGTPDAKGTAEGTVVVAGEPVNAPQTEAEVIAASTTGPTVLVKVPEDLQVNVRIEFEFDSAALGQDQKPKLTQLCKVMKDADIGLFRIVGHTDSSGKPDYNERLSLLRAQEVQRFFVNDCGIAPSRLEAVGLGERFLLDSTDPKGVENRRVEFQALS